MKAILTLRMLMVLTFMGVLFVMMVTHVDTRRVQTCTNSVHPHCFQSPLLFSTCPVCQGATTKASDPFDKMFLTCKFCRPAKFRRIS